MIFFGLAEIIFTWFEISCKWALMFYHPLEIAQMAFYSKPSISSRHPFVYSRYWPTVFLHSAQYLSSTSERRLRCGQDYIWAWFATMVGMMLYCPVCTIMVDNGKLWTIGTWRLYHYAWMIQPMRDDVATQLRLPLAEPIPRIMKTCMGDLVINIHRRIQINWLRSDTGYLYKNLSISTPAITWSWYETHTHTHTHIYIYIYTYISYIYITLYIYITVRM